MNLEQLCKGLQLNDGAIFAIKQIEINDCLYSSYKRLLNSDIQAFYTSVKQSPSYRQLFLALFARFAVDAYSDYAAKGISDDVYFDTFSDLRIWSAKCYRDNGVYGIDEYEWLQEHVRLALFRLGRLQFQPIALDHEVEACGRTFSKGQLVLNVHIPEGEPLDEHGVERSFELAKHFFRGIPPVFVCQSWLLYPQLNEVLPPNSNIMKFQRSFDVYKTDLTAKQAEERIFGKVCADPSLYETKTTLQHNARIYLLAGRPLGFGYGIRC